MIIWLSFTRVNFQGSSVSACELKMVLLDRNCYSFIWHKNRQLWTIEINSQVTYQLCPKIILNKEETSTFRWIEMRTLPTIQWPITLTIRLLMGIVAFRTNDGAAATRTVRDRAPSRRYSNTTESKSECHEPEMPECTSNNQCYRHSRCQAGICVCEKGWLTWNRGRQCSYEQK